MKIDNTREAILRFYALMKDHDYDSVVAEYQGKTETPTGPIDNKLFTAVETAVAKIHAGAPDEPRS